MVLAVRHGLTASTGVALTGWTPGICLDDRGTAQAAALAVLDVFEDESLVERAAQIGETIRDRMQTWQQRWPAIGDVRGLGAMLAIELVHDRGSKDPAPEVATAIVEAASERGLLLLKSGIYSNCIRVLVPLVVSDGEVDEALGVWEDALGSVLS